MNFVPIDAHTPFRAGMIVQATFAMTLTLLWWTDRRMRGMKALAIGCALTLASTTMHSLHPEGMRAVNDLPSAVVSLLAILAMYAGLRWFAMRTATPWRGPMGLVVGVAAVCLSLEFISPLTGLLLVRLATLSLLVFTIVTVWNPGVVELRRVMRCAAAGFALMTLVRVGIFALHIVATDWLPSAVYSQWANLIAVTMLQLVFVGVYVAEAKRRLHEETRLDPLTGVRNRRAMEEVAFAAVQSAASNGDSLALLMLDLDHFKQLNDTCGHLLGDYALQMIGGVLIREAGPRDCVARLGGEEFAVLMPKSTLAEAEALAERIRSNVEGLELSRGGQVALLRVSIGVSALHPGERDWGSMLHRADVALYRAKREGRNRVMVCDQQPAPETLAAAMRDGERRQSLWRRGPLL